MFTGIVERRARTIGIRTTPGGKHFTFEVEREPGLPEWTPGEIGESIAISGVCLTVVAARGAQLEFDAVPETLGLTTLGSLCAGDRVNIERSLRAGDRFGGHYVTGHIDGTGTVLDRIPEGDQVLFRIRPGEKLLGEMIPKGSITVDGVSLTIVEIARAQGWFSFAAIPHTLDITTLGAITAKGMVNLETDAFGKWVLHAIRSGDVDLPADASA